MHTVKEEKILLPGYVNPRRAARFCACDDDDDESELVDGDASENEIQNTVTQYSDDEDDPADDDDDEESRIGNVPHYCSLMESI